MKVFLFSNAVIKIIFMLTLIGFSSCKSNKSNKNQQFNLKDIKAKQTPHSFKIKSIWQKELHYLVLARAKTENLIYAISYKNSLKKPKPFMHIGLNPFNGVVKWTKKRSFRKFKFDNPYSIQAVMTKDQIFYLSKHRNIYSLSKETGSVGNLKIKTTAGFDIKNNQMFIATTPPYIYDINSGNKKYAHLKILDKNIPTKPTKTFPVQIFENTAVFKTIDGYIRGVDLTSLQEKWHFKDKLSSKKQGITLHHIKDTLLIPSIYPTYYPETIVEFQNNNQKFKIQLNGRFKKSSTVLASGNYVAFFTSSGKGTFFVTGIDIFTGKQLYEQEFITDKCTSTTGYFECRIGKTLKVFDITTGKNIYELNFSKKIRFISGKGNYLAMEFSNGKVSILDVNNKKILWNGKNLIKGTHAKLIKLLYGKGDRIALLLQTIWTDKPRLNRIYLKIISLSVSNYVRYFKLGIPPEKTRLPRISDMSGYIKQNLPVWERNGTIYSVVGGLYQNINIEQSKKGITAFMIPGKSQNEVSLVALRDGYALIERDDVLSLITPKNRLQWSKKITGFEFNFASDSKIFYKSFDNAKVFEIKTGKEIKLPIFQKQFPKIYAATNNKIYFTVKNGGKTEKYIANQKTLSKIQIIPDSYKYIANKNICIYYRNRKPDTVGSWTAINLKTGNIIWKTKFTKEPGDLGKAENISQIKPFIDSFYPPKWTYASPYGFLITGPAGKCLYSVDPSSGNITWTRCFHRIGNLPIIYDNKYILLSATPPFGEPGKPLKGTPPEGEGRLSLFIINAKTGLTQILYNPPEPYSVILQTFNTNSSEILITLYKEKRRVKKCILNLIKILPK